MRHAAFDVHVIAAGPPPAHTQAPRWRWRDVAWQRYLLSILLVGGATALSVLLHATLHIANLLMIFLFAEIIVALALGRGPAILASALGALAFDFFIVPPRFTLTVDDTEYVLTFLGLFAVGVLISTLTTRFRTQAEMAERRASETAILNELSRDLAAAGSLDAIIRAVIANIGDVFGREVVLLLPDAERGRRLVVGGQSPAFLLSHQEQEVAQWAFDHSQPAGRGTDTLAAAEARYLPLKTARGAVGVLGVKPTDPAAFLTPDQRRLLEAFASLAALAVERAQLAEEAERARIQVESERLRNSLLSSRRAARAGAKHLRRSQPPQRAGAQPAGHDPAGSGRHPGTQGLAAAGGRPRRGLDAHGAGAGRPARQRAPGPRPAAGAAGRGVHRAGAGQPAGERAPSSWLPGQVRPG